MDKQTAANLITQTFDAPFDEQRFANFARNLFNQIDESKTFSQQGAYISDAFKDHVRQYKRLGTYTDPEGTEIDVLIVRLKKETALDRARTMQRNFVARYLKERDEKDAALVAYYTDDQPDWRFSLVKMEYQIATSETTGRLKTQEILTPARRYSFLVGQNEPNHIAQQQLAPILQDTRHNPTLAQLEAAFNIESVTKEFFQKYKALFLDLKEELDRLVRKNKAVKSEFDRAEIDTANFAKKLLGQIVFLYFLQKKGWLGVGQGQAWGSGPKDFLRRLFEKQDITYANFFNDVLEPLFYEALAIERPGNLYPRLNCRIPFLNGGLFEPVGDYNWQTVDILLSNACFRDIFDTFDLFNFTVREDEPLEKEVAVDPEMLGKVFENLLEVTDRKSKGAFYTPREIVHYMCQESLINYLDTSLNSSPPLGGNEGGQPLIPPNAKQQKLFGDPDPEQLSLQIASLPLEGTEGGQTISREDIGALIRQGEFGLEHDAAKASGTKSYQYQLPPSIRDNAAAIDDALASIKICDPAIGSGAFPVGLMQEVVKTRTVLTTYLNASPPVGGIEGGQTRSPYDFKRHAIQESIYGVDIDPGAVDIAKLRLWLSLVVDEDSYDNIQPLPNLDYKIVCGNALLGVEKDLFNYDLFDRLEELITVHKTTTDLDDKRDLKNRIDRLISQLTHNNVQFEFEVYFSDVFRHHSGFDVVIGNPPYVRQELLRDQKPDLKKNHPNVFQGTADLYVYFYSQGFKILRDKGVLTFITSNKWLRANYGQNLRQHLAKTIKLIAIIDFGELPVFDAATFPMIFLGQKNEQTGQFTFLQVESLQSPYPNLPLLLAQNGQILPSQAVNGKDWSLTDPGTVLLLEKIKKIGQPLSRYVDTEIYRGIITGFNTAFVVDGKKRAELIAEDAKSADIIEPLAVGDDVRKWQVNYKNKWLIVTKIGVDIKRYPAIFRHLSRWQSQLKKRQDQGEHWWELRACAYYSEFNKPKIVYPDIAKESRFAFDNTGMYFTNTSYFFPSDDLYLLGVLNSNVIWKYASEKLTVIGDPNKGGRLRFFTQFVKDLPIAIPNPTQRKSIVTLVEYVLFLMEQPFVHTNELAYANDRLMVTYFEQLLNGMVYELYFPQELHQAEKQFVQPFLAEDLPTLDKIKGDKLAELRAIYTRLFDKNHLLRRNLFFLDSLDIIRIIEGKA